MVPLPDCAVTRVAERARRAARALDWKKESMVTVVYTDGDWMSNIYGRSEWRISCQVSDLGMLFQKNGFVKERNDSTGSLYSKVTNDGQIPDRKKIQRSKRATKTIKEERKRRKRCKGIDISTCSQIACFPCC